MRVVWWCGDAIYKRSPVEICITAVPPPPPPPPPPQKLTQSEKKRVQPIRDDDGIDLDSDPEVYGRDEEADRLLKWERYDRFGPVPALLGEWRYTVETKRRIEN